MSENKKHRSADEILKYLRGETSGRERHDFERQMESDPFEREAMEGLEGLSPGQAEEDILSLHARLRKRLARRRRIAIYSAAATVASLLIIGTIFLQIYDFNPDKEQGALTEEEFPVITREPEVEEVAAAGEEKKEAPVITETEKESAPAAVPHPGEVNGKRSAEPAGPEETKRSAEQEKSETTVAMEVSEEEPKAMAPGEVRREREAKGPSAGKGSETTAQVPDAEESLAVTDDIVAVEAEAAAPRQFAAAPKASRRKMAVTREEFAGLASGEVKGVVLSAEDMDPLQGASVYLKEGDTGVVTDMRGRFSLPAEADATSTLITRFVGMETGEYQVTEGSDVELVMQPDISSANEIVMIGYPDGTTYWSGDTKSMVYSVSGKQKSSGTPAQPSIGYEAFGRYIEENLRFPSRDTISRAVVILQFTVTSDGKIRNIRPVRTPGKNFTREAARLISEGPSWNPAVNASGTTDEEVQLRILFIKK